MAKIGRWLGFIPTESSLVECQRRVEPLLNNILNDVFAADFAIFDVASKTTSPISTVGRNNLGAKVWVLPRRYYVWCLKERERLLVAADLKSNIRKWPRLHCVAQVETVEIANSSGVKFSLGKDVIGVVATPNGVSDESLVHHRQLRPELSAMSWFQYQRLSRRAKLGRSKSDADKLRDRYGSTVVSEIVEEARNQPSFGCVTVHTPKGVAFTDDSCNAVASMLSAQKGTIGANVIAGLGWKPVHTAREFSQTASVTR